MSFTDRDTNLLRKLIREETALRKWGDTTLTGRDISLDLAKLDVALSTRATEATLALLLYSNLEPVIEDPGFESGGITQWSLDYTTGGSYSVQSTEKYEGTYALRVSPEANGYFRGIAQGDFIPSSPKQRIRIAAALKADANISASYLVAEFYNINFNVLGRNRSQNLGSNYDWKEVEVPTISDSPAGTCFYRIGFEFRSGATAGIAYCDKFSVPHPLKGAGRRTLTDLYNYLASETTLANIKANTDNIVVSTQVSKYAVAMTDANTEYSQPLTNVKKFRIHTRDYTAFRLAYVTGKVAVPNDPYETIPDGSEKYEGDLNIASLTLYFASSVAGKTAEIEVWS